MGRRGKIAIAGMTVLLLCCLAPLVLWWPSEETAVVSLPPTLDGVLLGTVNNNGSVVSGLHTCVANEAAVLQLLNEHLSYVSCLRFAEPPGCQSDEVNQSFTVDELARHFTIQTERHFFRIEKQSEAFDHLLRTSPGVTSFFVCRDDWMTYLNLTDPAHALFLYSPHPFPEGARDAVSSRRFSAAYLTDPGRGVAQLAPGVEPGDAVLEQLMGLLYATSYFPVRDTYSGSDGRIVNRRIWQEGGVWRLQDEVLLRTWSDFPPFSSSEAREQYSLTLDPATGLVSSSRVRVDSRMVLPIP